MKSMFKTLTVCGLSLCLVGLAGSAFAQTGASPTPPPARENPPGRERPARPDQPDRQRPARPSALVGSKVGEWSATDSNGKTHKSADYTGKIVVLEWVNPQCPVCKAVHEDGRVSRMLGELKGMKDVVFLGVNSTAMPAVSTAEENNAALKKYGVDYPVLLDADGKIGRMLGARTTPHVFVIDSTGVLRYAGAIDNNEKGDMTGDKYQNFVVNAVRQIQAGESVSPDTTKPYGCSVKYAGGGARPGRGEGQGREGRPPAPAPGSGSGQ